MAKVLPYNMRKPYKYIVSQVGAILIQNGIVYEHGSGRVLGPVNKAVLASKGLVMCEHSAATFPDTPEGREALTEYQNRKGFTKKAKPGEVEHKESTIEERQEVVAKNIPAARPGKKGPVGDEE